MEDAIAGRGRNPRFGSIRGEGWSSWALTPNGIYFINDTEPHATLAYFEFATHRIVRISAMDKPPSVGLAVAPDGRSILYVQNEFSESNIMLVKNFPLKTSRTSSHTLEQSPFLGTRRFWTGGRQPFPYREAVKESDSALNFVIDQAH